MFLIPEISTVRIRYQLNQFLKHYLLDDVTENKIGAINELTGLKVTV